MSGYVVAQMHLDRWLKRITQAGGTITREPNGRIRIKVGPDIVDWWPGTGTFFAPQLHERGYGFKQLIEFIEHRKSFHESTKPKLEVVECVPEFHPMRQLSKAWDLVGAAQQSLKEHGDLESAVKGLARAVESLAIWAMYVEENRGSVSADSEALESEVAP